MVFGEIVLLQCHPHQLEMVGRMPSDANRISDSVVSDDTGFVTGYILKKKQKQIRVFFRLNKLCSSNSD